MISRRSAASKQGEQIACHTPEEGLARDILQDHEFRSCRQVRVDAIYTEGSVVLHVVLFKHHRVRNADGQVRKHGKDSVGPDALEDEVVSDFVNRKEEVLVRGPTDEIGGEHELPAEDRGVA